MQASSVRRNHRYTWMPNGWLASGNLGPGDGGTEFLTIGCPGDFVAVRVGFANVSPQPYTITTVRACASSSWGDTINPVEGGDWTTLTCSGGNTPADDAIVTRPDVRAPILVSGNMPDAASGEATNPAWTWTDWQALASANPDPETGMRVLMLRCLVPSNQVVTATNGSLAPYTRSDDLNLGFRHIIGGIKADIDCVTDPAVTRRRGLLADNLARNRIRNGQMMAIVQFLTVNPGVTIALTGDSHHQGTSTTSEFLSFGLRCAVALGRTGLGSVPVGYANLAVGGATSQVMFPRLIRLLPDLRPDLVILPGWTYNEGHGTNKADAVAIAVFLARLIKTAETIQANGGRCIFLTPFPRNAASMSEVQLGPWRHARDAILGMRAAGALVLDAASLLGASRDGILDGTYSPSTTTDMIHPNDTGHRVIAEALGPLIQQAICLRGYS
jgi:hypothetical protein